MIYFKDFLIIKMTTICYFSPCSHVYCPRIQGYGITHYDVQAEDIGMVHVLSHLSGGSLGIDSHHYCASFGVKISRLQFLSCYWVHLLVLVLLGIALEQFVSKFGVINDYFLFSHIVDCLVSIALDRVVVLVDLYSQASTSGEVIWLWKMSQAMVLHSLQDVLHAHPLASLAKSLLASLWPDLIKAWHNEGSSFDLENHLELASNYLLGDLWLCHVEHLFAIHSPNIIHLLQAGTISRGESLDTCNLSSEGNILPPLHCEPPLLLEGVPLHLNGDQLLHHVEHQVHLQQGGR